MIKAVIFDLDGVVVDSKIQDYAAWKRIFSEHRYDLNYNKYLSLLGMKGEEVLRECINPNITKEEALKIINQKEGYFIEEIEKTELKPIKGLKKLFELLKKSNIKIGLGTSAPRDKVNVILEKIGIKSSFDAVVVDEEVTKGKPYPEVYLKVSKKLGINPKECIVIEDAPKGVKAAKNAGMKCIAITTTHKKEELAEADKIINSFSELTLEMIKI